MNNYISLLDKIDPSRCSYQEWVNVGMALKYEGYGVDVWEKWSSRDAARYHHGECMHKWETFRGSDTPVTGGTLVAMAKNTYTGISANVNTPRVHHEAVRDAVICDNGLHTRDNHTDEHHAHENRAHESRAHIEPQKPQSLRGMPPVRQLITYLETLFRPDEKVGYVTQTYEQNGRRSPTMGCYDRTAAQLIEQLNRCGDVGAALGGVDPAVGAWIRFNPLNGMGIRDENVTAYRYALVESDSMDIKKQYELICSLELPVACLVHSGNKSLHAVVRIDAADAYEYRERVEYLYKTCKENGLDVDPQNRNPSRLSRMPGVPRGGKSQFLIHTNIGKRSWEEWVAWLEAPVDEPPEEAYDEPPEAGDELPPIESEHIGERGDLAPCLINGILRQGHKLLLAGSSKAGKSFALIELAVCISEGLPWLGRDCAQGNVLYVNLELDAESCKERFALVREALHAPSRHSVDLWHLRGRSVPMDRLVPKLISRAQRKDYIAVIIDPIYKVITGDENSADQMAFFCNQFDRICTELGCAVIYCHHHSKGAQGQKKSMDRASGSGVFSRDPDALLDLIELEPEESVFRKLEDAAVVRVCAEALEKYDKEPDEGCTASEAIALCEHTLSKFDYGRMFDRISAAKTAVRSRTAWRMDCTLREFRKPDPLDMWFEYPVHIIDREGLLKSTETDCEEVYNDRKREKKSDGGRPSKIQQFRSMFDNLASLSGSDSVKIVELADAMNVSCVTVKNYVRQLSEEFERNDGFISRVKETENL